MRKGPLSLLLITALAGSGYTQQEPLISADQVRAIYTHIVQEHWSPKTHLFIAYVRTGDRKMSQQASTYEQAAIGLLALRLQDRDRAMGIYSFFKDRWAQDPLLPGDHQGVKGFTNFYNADYGGPGIEKIIHVGPNAWMALFCARLARQYQNPEAFQLALDILSFIAHDVPHERGGVAMSPLDTPDVPWTKVYSTENNISYTAALGEALRSPYLQASDRAWLQKERAGIEGWLKNVTFDPKDSLMNRGVNPMGLDHVRALDTFTWLIALGPEHLRQLGMDPDRLMAQANRLFVVDIKGRKGVDPTDQVEADAIYRLREHDKSGHPSRPETDGHRLIWYEGLGQYINALEIMAADNRKHGRAQQAHLDALEARQLSADFDRAALTPYAAGSAFAYATYGKMFHDSGSWWAPDEGAEGAPSSAIAATWRCFAGLGMNPLLDEAIPGVQTVSVSAPASIQVKRAEPTVPFGSSEDMVTQAWQQLEQGQHDQAIQQAQATIQEWAGWARDLQKKKWTEVGHLIDYKSPEDAKKIYSYWALNDVAAAYFIMGKVFDQQKQYANAQRAFQQITEHYALAQVWDPRGWFWAPADAVKKEYAERDPDHYGGLTPQAYSDALIGKPTE